MSKYQTTTIKKTVENIVGRKYLLPAIQRKFVWSSEQIEMLFDSILRGYPINSFMFWKIENDDIKSNNRFYEFIRDYQKKFNEDNPEIETRLLNGDLYAVIDGQQRMNSLYIGLCGTYRTKKPNKWWNNSEEAMPTKRLYLELSQKLDDNNDDGKLYNFIFLSLDELKDDIVSNQNHHWFKVGDIIDFKNLSDVSRYLKNNKLPDDGFAADTLFELMDKVNNTDLINYFEVDEQNQDKVLDIFVRTNSGGTPLSFSDLLMSVTSNNWQMYDARKEIQIVKDEIFTYGSPSQFSVSQDFILKSILVLTDSDVKFKIANFSSSNINSFEQCWPKIKNSLIETFKLLDKLGFNDNILISKNVAIPIAYFIYKNNLVGIITSAQKSQDNNKKLIAKWLRMSLLKGIFGGQSDNVLVKMRNVIKKSNSKDFPLDEIKDAFKSDPNKNYSFTEDIINPFLEEHYGTTTSWLVLDLLYPDIALNYGKSVAQDHMHPKIMFKNNKLKEFGIDKADYDFYKKYYNTILNLQLLESSINTSKNDQQLKSWVEQNPNYRNHLYIKNDTSLDFKDFKRFINDRRDEMGKRLLEIVNC